MKLKYIHEKEVTEHDNGYVHEIIRDQNRSQQTFCVFQQFTDSLIRRVFLFCYYTEIRRRERKNAISEADAKPETSRSKPANTMAMIAGIEGACTDIPLKISANWHK